jgi:hypothetical protein
VGLEVGRFALPAVLIVRSGTEDLTINTPITEKEEKNIGNQHQQVKQIDNLNNKNTTLIAHTCGASLRLVHVAGVGAGDLDGELRITLAFVMLA